MKNLAHNIPKHIQEFIQSVESLLNIPVYLVGGAVRDTLLGQTPKDWDFATPASPDQIEEAIKKAGRRAFCIGKKFGTIGCKFPVADDFRYIEITTFRTEKYQEKNRKPIVEFSNNIELDLARRDFTINAIAINSKGKIIDPYKGVSDINAKTIKAVGNPRTRFKEDPLRILRGIRLSSKLDFTIEQNTAEKMQEKRISLLNISKERWIDELDKILSLEDPSFGLELLMDLTLWQIIIPEISLQKNYDQNSPYHDFSLWEHTKKVVKSTPKENLELRWSALLHDIAKPFTRTENKKGHSNYIGHELLGAEMSLKASHHLKFSKKRREYIYQTILTHLQENSALKPYDDQSKKAPIK